MTLRDMTNKTSKLLTDNSPAILTALGVTGLVTTAYLTGKASFKASELLREAKLMALSTQHGSNVTAKELNEILSSKEKVEVVWKLYIPAVTSGVLTTACIVCANRIGTRRAAAMTAAFTLSERAYSEYKEKVFETIGKNKEQKIRDDVAQDRVKNNPPVDGQIIMTTGGDQMFMDAYSGRYFNSNMEDVKAAQNALNHEVLNHGYASLSDLYSQLGLSNTKISDDIGWSSDKLLEMMFSATMTEDNRACIVMDFMVAPVRSFSRTH